MHNYKLLKVDLKLFDGAAAAPAGGDAGAGAQGAESALPKAEINSRNGSSRRSKAGAFDNVVFGKQEDASQTETANDSAAGSMGEGNANKSGVMTTSDTIEAKRAAFKELIERGHDVTFVAPRDGYIHPEDVAREVREDTVLVSIMHVNNETGALNDIAAIASAVKARNPKLLFHSDGVQGFIKCPLNLSLTEIDYYTVSAHKLGGLKGTGGIFHRNGTPLRAHILGGGQEKGLRSGTENTLGVLLMQEAARLTAENAEENAAKCSELRQAFLDSIATVNHEVISPKHSVNYILSVSFPDVRAEVLVHLLEQQEIYISTGSACSSKKGKQSRISRALGLSAEIAGSMVRISFSAENAVEDMKTTAAVIKDAIRRFGGFKRR